MANWISKASTYKECHDNIHTYFPSKKICQGGYLCELAEDNQICKTALCSSDSRFYSLHQMLQLWIVHFDATSPKHSIPNSESPSIWSYSSSDLFAVEYYLEYPYNSTDLFVNVTSINDANIILMTRNKKDPNFLEFYGYVSSVGLAKFYSIGPESFKLNELFSSVVLFYKPNSESSSATFSISWNNTQSYQSSSKHFSYMKLVYFAVYILIIEYVAFAIWFIELRKKRNVEVGPDLEAPKQREDIELETIEKENKNQILGEIKEDR